MSIDLNNVKEVEKALADIEALEGILQLLTEEIVPIVKTASETKPLLQFVLQGHKFKNNFDNMLTSIS